MKGLKIEARLEESVVINGNLLETVWISDNEVAGALYGYLKPLAQPKKLKGNTLSSFTGDWVNLICVERSLYVDNEQS